MPHSVETASFDVDLLRVAAIVGFALTLVGAGFVFIYASLVEGSYEAAVRSEPWEWAIAASVVGAISAVSGIYSIAVCSRAAVRVAAGVQAMTVLVLLTVALLSDFDLRGSDFERNFITLTLLGLVFDAAVFLASWALRHRTQR